MRPIQQLDGAFLPHDEVQIEDDTVEVDNYDGLVVAGLGSIVYARPGVTVRPEPGSTVYLAPGADLDAPAEGALERCDYTVTPWAYDEGGTAATAPAAGGQGNA